MVSGMGIQHRIEFDRLAMRMRSFKHFGRSRSVVVVGVGVLYVASGWRGLLERHMCLCLDRIF